MICKNVLSIVLLYVKQNELESFFILYNLIFDLQFKYGTCCDTFVKKFSGMNCEQIIVMDYFQTLLSVPLRNSKSIVMYNLNYQCICEVVKNAVNSKSFVFLDVRTHNFDFLAKCHKLESIKFYACTWKSSCDFLAKCVNLKRLDFDCVINDNDVVSISQIKNLRELRMNALKCRNGMRLCCKNLRKLRVTTSYFDYGFDFNALCEYDKLREIKLVRLGFRSYFDFSKFRDLRRIVFKRCHCHNGLCFSGLDKCEKLEYVKFVRCVIASISDIKWINDLRKRCCVKIYNG